MKQTHAVGFDPVYNEQSEVLILGSFPSVKSREINFYYGHPQNRFWKTVCAYFGEEEARSVEERRQFLLRRKIALWDVVSECDIIGSSDVSIKNAVVADIISLTERISIKRILCNGKTAYGLLQKYFPQIMGNAVLLPSTSPANPRFCKEAWFTALTEAFSR